MSARIESMRSWDSQCKGKIAFEDMGKANQALRNMKRIGGGVLESYKCPHCKKWHLGRR